MRILHGPQNIGGMAGVLAKAQRQCGVEAYAYCLSTGSFHYPADRIIQATRTWGRASELFGFFLREGLQYDAFQFYFGTSFTGLGLDEVPFLKALGKKIYFFFCGCDVRDSKLTITKYRYNACSGCWPMLCSPNRSKALAVAQRYGDQIFVSTPDLLEFVPRSHLIPQPIDLSEFEKIYDHALTAKHSDTDSEPSKATERVTVAHAPSNRSIKGTHLLIDAIRGLQQEGVPVDLHLVEGKSYEEALRTCAKADIAVDQLLVGAYGQYSVEMMALGKPVICYIREDLRKHYPPGLPIVSTDVDHISDTLRTLIRDRGSWPAIGRAGTEYVKNYHDSLAVAKLCLQHYQ